MSFSCFLENRFKKCPLALKFEFLFPSTKAKRFPRPLPRFTFIGSLVNQWEGRIFEAFTKTATAITTTTTTTTTSSSSRDTTNY
ncbi:hypothetical protein T03_9661 [Trichinella britovi]|uniref:Uncharacterized protein n=1 Tax=Trichinella britovi TaxID=45882 RepID=A0A0V1DIB4_TRIBR|nr:hypothetical protein T03_9661 [Trichinella britovi]